LAWMRSRLKDISKIRGRIVRHNLLLISDCFAAQKSWHLVKSLLCWLL
jgi:hypothetical protein